MTEKALRIGIDISTLLNHGPDIGAGRYIFNLIRNLLKVDKKNSYILTGRYIRNDCTDNYIKIVDNLKKELNDGRIELKIFNVSRKNLNIWDRVKFPPLELAGFKADILHCPDFLIPPALNRNIILTIHDLAFIRHPDFNFEWFIKKYTREVRQNIRKAKMVIADSLSTKNDIIKFFNTDPEKVEVIYLAADRIFRKLSENEIDTGILRKYKINKKYILSVGTIEPRKNFDALIRAFNRIKQKSAGAGYKLVITGRTGWKSEATYAERESSPFKEDILFTGRVPDEDLVQLYNQAELFVYPSLFEGFGLPPLEAMSCGIPVIALDTSSLKEVIGDGGILVEAGNEQALENEILNVIKNNTLKEMLKEKSLVQAGKFSWEDTAQKTIELYNKII
ncbi:MAG: glycosyltransferase family 1 protein [Candidatus Humimicrobiaceae bacterium]|jgi:glycosyltransferase involved in cell wall biosynthesis|nr:glycosyltransferase family 1 protein [Candidatus Humimicrobiaceae bacterium]